MPLRLVVYIYLALLPLAQAWAGNILLVLNDTSGPYAEFSRTLESVLSDQNWKIEASFKADSLDLAQRRPDLIVTAGSEAFRQALSHPSNFPILATLLPRQNYERILAETGKGRHRVSTIYLDQPPARLASFIRHLLPGHKRIGILTSSETRPQIAQFSPAFTQAGLSLETEHSDTDNALVPALNTLLQRAHLLLAIPDSTIYKRDNIRSILVTSYRTQKPVIGFSAAMVGAGALAALYSTPSQIARQTAEMITGSPASAWPAASAPSLFAIAINPSVAQALGLGALDEAQVRRAMLAEKDVK